jgi:TonB-dependent SusC/RagA subfamily outer membrane receptor
MKKRIFLILLVLVWGVTSVSAQKAPKNIKVSGYVTDGTHAPVANAIVLVDGHKTDLLTDDKGFYKIKVKAGTGKIGIFTFTNGVMEEPVNGRTRINFMFEGSVPDQMSYQTAKPEETVNIGYGTVKKKNMTTNVGKIDGTNPKYASYRTIYDMIRGEVPGVQVTGTTITIQGISSMTLGTEPLYVVDGIVVSSIGDIQPSMVKSIEILKGSSAAIYGSRGANGVILIKLLGAPE